MRTNDAQLNILLQLYQTHANRQTNCGTNEHRNCGILYNNCFRQLIVDDGSVFTVFSVFIHVQNEMKRHRLPSIYYNF